MSVQAITWALTHEVGDPIRKNILFVLANRADEYGICWPGQAFVAKLSECSIRTVQRHLAALEAAGLILRKKRGRANGGRTSDLIRLNMAVEGALKLTHDPLPVTVSPKGVKRHNHDRGISDTTESEDTSFIDTSVIESPDRCVAPSTAGVPGQGLNGSCGREEIPNNPPTTGRQTDSACRQSPKPKGRDSPIGSHRGPEIDNSCRVPGPAPGRVVAPRPDYSYFAHRPYGERW